MGVPPDSPPPSRPEAPIHSIQPGGGWCMRLELAWGRLRRWFLRGYSPAWVAAMQAKRQGTCTECPGQLQGCHSDIIDPRDLKYHRNVCGFQFAAEDDPFRWRDRLGLARAGLAECVVFSLILGGLFAACLVLTATSPHPWKGVAAGVGMLVLALWLLILWFFRDPERRIPDDPLALVSPADGTVVEIGEVDDPAFPGGRAYRIGIFLSIFNVHVNRAPRPARVVRRRYFPGEYLNALRPLSALVNEQLWIEMEDRDLGHTLVVKQIAGAIARRIVCWLRVGDVVEKGERMGMIKVGSRTEILVPAAAPFQVVVSKGQKVRGGETMLLVFAPKPPELRVARSSANINLDAPSAAAATSQANEPT